jgi:hypothetical protein
MKGILNLYILFSLLITSCAEHAVRRPSGAVMNQRQNSFATFAQQRKMRVNNGSCMEGIHRLVREGVLVELSSGMEHRIPFQISERLSNEIVKSNEDVARRAMDSYISSMESRGLSGTDVSVRLNVKASGGGVLYTDGYLDLSALRLTEFDVFPYTEAFMLNGKQAGVAQMPWKINGSHINSVILEHPTADLAPHARTFIDQALREADLSDKQFFKANNMVLQMMGKRGKLKSYWIISQPNTNPLGRKLYEDYLDFVMDVYTRRIGVDDQLAVDLKSQSMELMDRSITIIATDKRLAHFEGEGGALFQNFFIKDEVPGTDDILGGISLVISRSNEERIPSELFRKDFSIRREPGEVLIEVTRRATRKGNKDVSLEVVFQILAMLKGMKKAKRVVIEVEEAGYNAFKKYGFKPIAAPIESFRGKEYTLIADIEEAYEKMVSHTIRSGNDLQKYFLEYAQ